MRNGESVQGRKSTLEDGEENSKECEESVVGGWDWLYLL
jgi:hypothetical protein